MADAPVQVVAAGRTDTGVHATNQVVSFESRAVRELKAWTLGTNSHLPDAIRVRWAREVQHDFHARYSALWRRYIYLCFCGDADPLASGRVLFTPELDDAAMQAAARHLVGERDFSTFRASGCQSESPYRLVHHARVHRWGPLVGIDVQANAFLLRMMRNIAGALVQVGTGSWQPGDFAAALAARSRTAMGRTAAPDGLYLVGVGYPDGQSDEPLPEGALPPILAGLTSLDRL